MKITRKILISIVISVALILSNIFLFGHVTGTSYAQISPLEVIKCSVIVPEEFYVSYQGNNQKDFPNGFKPAVGSGITVKSVNSDGSIELYFITDRGPNTDGPKYKDVSNEYKSIIFPAPKFQPQIALGILKNGKVEVVETIALKNKEGEPVTGLPITPGLIGATNEIALTENLQIIGYSNDGLDPEGIALDHEGNFWICDEYGPFVAKFDKKGKLLKKYAPNNGLPEVLKYRIPNRGFEGITVAPNGKIYIAMQSVLNIEGKTAVTAQFTRIVELDPLTGKTRMYAYPIDRENYKSPKDAKIGDIFAISNDKLLLIEQGKDKEKRCAISSISLNYKAPQIFQT
ncbi:MAG: hypothetical protein PWP42_737 [Candidatus Atribacteria bacterium]|nr:hypothetical protein [Candidatus Atribacteria bacterium]